MTNREKAIVMAYTGTVMLAGDELDVFYRYANEKLGRCVMTHELAFKEVQDALADAAKDDFIELAKSDNSHNNGWISVKDRLPERQEPVLVYVPSYSDEDEEYIGHAAMSYYTHSANGGYWAGTDGNVYGAIGIIHEPSHWMPLPEPPKEKEPK